MRGGHPLAVLLLAASLVLGLDAASRVGFSDPVAKAYPAHWTAPARRSRVSGFFQPRLGRKILPSGEKHPPAEFGRLKAEKYRAAAGGRMDGLEPAEYSEIRLTASRRRAPSPRAEEPARAPRPLNHEKPGTRNTALPKKKPAVGSFAAHAQTPKPPRGHFPGHGRDGRAESTELCRESRRAHSRMETLRRDEISARRRPNAAFGPDGTRSTRGRTPKKPAVSRQRPEGNKPIRRRPARRDHPAEPAERRRPDRQKEKFRPPPDDLRPPDFTALLRRTPGRLPDGTPVDPEPPSPEEAERMSPPDQEPKYDLWRESDGRARSPRWHSAGEKTYLHEGSAWGVAAGKWSWMMSRQGRWWMSAGGRALVWHEGRWWWRDSGAWFYLLGGRPRLWAMEDSKPASAIPSVLNLESSE